MRILLGLIIMVAIALAVVMPSAGREPLHVGSIAGVNHEVAGTTVGTLRFDTNTGTPFLLSESSTCSFHEGDTVEILAWAGEYAVVAPFPSRYRPRTTCSSDWMFKVPRFALGHPTMVITTF